MHNKQNSQKTRGRLEAEQDPSEKYTENAKAIELCLKEIEAKFHSGYESNLKKHKLNGICENLAELAGYRVTLSIGFGDGSVPFCFPGSTQNTAFRIDFKGDCQSGRIRVYFGGRNLEVVPSQSCLSIDSRGETLDVELKALFKELAWKVAEFRCR